MIISKNGQSYNQDVTILIDGYQAFVWRELAMQKSILQSMAYYVKKRLSFQDVYKEKMSVKLTDWMQL